MSIYNVKSREPSQSEKDAYQAGIEAARNGVDWKANPHRALSLQSYAWSNGWFAGRDSQKSNR